MLIKSPILSVLTFATLALFLHGCSGRNDNAPALVDGKHPADWVVAHRAAFRNNPNQCQECHGSDLKGGIAKVDCFNQGNLPSCHAGGHGPRLATHVVPFKDPALHGPDAKANLIVCQGCHGQPGGPGSNPRFSLLIGSLPTGCEAAGCHLPNMAHPKPWNDHATAGNQANACPLCHGATLGGPTDPNGAGVGPACSSCHRSLLAGALPLPGLCTSCHGNPPNGTGYPNIAGSHAAHLQLGGVDCSTCHNQFGTGSHAHYSSARVQQLLLPANMAFIPAYNARSGAVAYTPSSRSCSNAKCHGGQTTPPWGAQIDVTTGCLLCHQQGTAAQTPQFNSFFSGLTVTGVNLHRFHLDLGLFCTDCHDMTNPTAPSHFSNLSSVTFNQAPANTIRDYIRYNRNTPSCQPPATPPAGNTFTACHSDLRLWHP